MNFLKPRPFIISAPSGTGKSSLFLKAREILPPLTLSVSHTTRLPRKSEKNGIDYFFIDRKSFQEMIDRHEFVEWAEVYGNYYGTSKKFIEENNRSGNIIVLNIDTQGALQVMEKSNFNPVFVFITPPSIAELERRLKDRRTETAESLQKRLSFAEKELSYRNRYDYVIQNENLGDAVNRFLRIVLYECFDQREAANIDIEILSHRLGDRSNHHSISKLTEILRELLKSRSRS